MNKDERKVWIEVTVEEAKKINDGLLNRPLKDTETADLVMEFKRRSDSKMNSEEHSIITNKRKFVYIIDEKSMLLKLEVNEK